MKIFPAIVSIAVVGFAFCGYPQEETGPLLEYPHGADRIVLQLDYVPEINYGIDREPLLRIYGDGRTLLHPFSYDARKGPHEMFLEEQDIKSLLLYLYDMGLMEFDEQSVTAKKSNALQERNRVAAQSGEPTTQHYVADSSTLVIDVFLSKYRQDHDTGTPIEDFHAQVKWYALLDDAKEFPEVPELSALKEIETTLTAYTKNQALVPLNTGAQESIEVER